MTDRATLHTQLTKLQGKTTLEVKVAMIKVLTKINYPINTLTFDNDKAFSEHQSIGQKLTADTYFTRPYTSQDKGTVENRIGVIRRFFPEKTDLLIVSKKDVKLVERKLNNRPVRKFNYSTHNQLV